MKKTTLSLLLVYLVVLFFEASLFAEETGNRQADNNTPAPYELDAMVVTAGKHEETVDDIPAHVTIISQDDIKESTAQNIIDLLAQEPGISVRTTFGNDKQAVVDIRGMGDTAASNVLVMVDNVIINSPDQSGPSISSVPLEQIDRIEIVRGAGSVVYGNGAVGGVVNIITEKAGGSPAARVYSSYGSWETLDNRVSLDGSLKNLFLSFDAGCHDSDGYRDNGFFQKKDVHLKTNYPVTDWLALYVSGAYYEDEYGLPGPVSKEKVDSTTLRIQTDHPNDNGETSEARGRLEFDMDFGKWGTLNLKRGYLLRDNRYIIGFNPQIPKTEQRDKIDENTRQFDLNYVKRYELGDHSQMFQLGVDHYQTFYYREERPDGPRHNSDTESFGIFINNRWAVTEKLTISAGSRYNTYQGRFRTDGRKLFDDQKIWVNGDATKSEWTNSARSLGFTYALTETTSIFTNYSTSFRVPNVDEFAESEDGLKPQKGTHYEIGGTHQFTGFFSVTISLFDIRIDDEIYYSDINRNYDDKTIRRGIETDFTIYPTENIRLWGSYTYTSAEFAGKTAKIPMVPEHHASMGVYWQLMPNLGLSLSGNYTGSRFDGNDTENDRYTKLPAYFVSDGKLTYQYKDLTVFAGVNNMFNELYVTSAYSEQYYPMPERTIYGGIRWAYF